MSNSPETPLTVPRREFLKYAGVLSAGAAFSIYVTTDAKEQQNATVKTVGGTNIFGYGYQEP